MDWIDVKSEGVHGFLDGFEAAPSFEIRNLNLAFISDGSVLALASLTGHNGDRKLCESFHLHDTHQLRWYCVHHQPLAHSL